MILSQFLSWHYSWGVSFYIKRYVYALGYIIHFFSLFKLPATLFAPWKRLADTSRSSGFDFRREFEKFTYNFVSRFIGVFVRAGLFVIGILSLFLIAFLGAVGFIFWIILPFLSLRIYFLKMRSSANLAMSIKRNASDYPEQAVSYLFSNAAGEFVLKHTGLVLSDLINFADIKKVNLKGVVPSSYATLLDYFLERGVWDESFFSKRGISRTDLVLAARWWERLNEEETRVDVSLSYSGAGIGASLVYGYTPTLDKYFTRMDFVQPFEHHLIGRQNVVSRMERALNSGMSVFLVGPPGVGKKTVVLEFANRARKGELGSELSYKKIFELNLNFIFSQSTDLNQKKLRLSEILSESSQAGNVILVVRDLHRIVNASVEGYDFTDIIESFLEKKDLKIISISTDTEYEKFIVPNLRIRKFFETVEVVQPSKEEAMEILFEAASRWEKIKKVVILTASLRRILDSSDRYITETPFPEKALELLDSVVIYKSQMADKIISPVDVDAVMSEKTGIKFAEVTGDTKNLLLKLESVIHKRLVNQKEAVEMIAKILRSKSLGVVKSSRPIGSFLFLGPTGVGKTETAKVLAKVYFGSEKHIVRFDMAEYVGDQGVERLLGSQASGEPGVLTTAIKNRPASLLLLDEIEKASPQIINLFLSVLDEGIITDAFGKKINCQNLFIVATSNAGAEYIRRLVSGNEKASFLHKKVIEYVLRKGIFSPEFINRFDGVVVYEPLGRKELVMIASIMLNDFAAQIKEKNIFLQISDSAISGLVEKGYDPSFGARPMRRVLDIEIGDAMSRAILNNETQEGDLLEIYYDKTQKKFGFTKVNKKLTTA